MYIVCEHTVWHENLTVITCYNYGLSKLLKEKARSNLASIFAT